MKLSLRQIANKLDFQLSATVFTTRAQDAPLTCSQDAPCAFWDRCVGASWATYPPRKAACIVAHIENKRDLKLADVIHNKLMKLMIVLVSRYI